MALKAVFFDFAGTLLDEATDRRAHLYAFEKIADDLALPMNPQELFEAFETDIEPRLAQAAGEWLNVEHLHHEAFFSILPSLGIEVTEETWTGFWELLMENHRQYLAPTPYASSVLKDAKALGLHVGLISDVGEGLLAISLEAVHIEEFLDSVTSSEEVGKAKARKEVFLAALKKAGCGAEDAVYVGDDAAHDIGGAKRAGLRGIHYAEDKCHKADFCVPTLQDVALVLKDLVGAE
jgi:putative hydrolase of the HAD superfamily